MATADTPAAKPEAKPKPEPTGLEAAAASTDPLVQKLMWDRGTNLASGDTADSDVAAGHTERRVAGIDAELRKLGFDV